MIIYPNYNFFCINHQNYNLTKLMTLWEYSSEFISLLSNDSSLTQRLYAFSNRKVKLSFQSFLISSLASQLIRTSILMNSSNQILIFAQSFWLIKNNKHYFYLESSLLGRLLIGKNFDFYKNTITYYFGYSRHLTNLFQSRGIIIGREYLLYKNKKKLFIMQEFFSPLFLLGLNQK
uniref:Ycf21 n=1 Tax=Pterocladiophila hemisphaerica TaxID=2712948 RepID=A0A6M3WWD5_9FLOR|nr:Ycf21 [Pterocladiophila hemisphaerica]